MKRKESFRLTEKDRINIDKIMRSCDHGFVESVDEAVQAFTPAASLGDEYEDRNRRQAVFRVRINSIRVCAAILFDKAGIGKDSFSEGGYSKLLSELNLYYCCEKLADIGLLRRKDRISGERQKYAMDKLGKAALELMVTGWYDISDIDLKRKPDGE